MAYNRELSQFAPFVYVDDTSNNIGIATTALPSVGIGTTIPTGKFEVEGHTELTNLNVSVAATIANLQVSGITETLNFQSNGISTFVGFSTFNDNIIVAGLSTFAGVVTTFTDLYVGGDLYVGDDLFFDELSARNAVLSGNLQVAGVSTFVGFTTFQSDAIFLDNDTLYFGDGNDLSIYHDGSNSYILDNGDGNLYIQGSSSIELTDPTGLETYAVFNQNGSVELSYNGNTKFETTGIGVTISDDLSVSGVIGIGTTANTSESPLVIYSTDYTSTFISERDSGENSVWIKTGDSDVVALRFENALQQWRIGVQSGDILTFRDVTNTSNSVGITTSSELLVGDINSTGTSNQLLQVFGGAYFQDNVGIGTTLPLNTLQVGLANSSFTVVSTATTTLIGIGTTNPQLTLDVKGDTNIEGSVNVDGSLSVNQSAVATIGLVIALGG